MSELIVWKLRNGRPLTADERLWIAEVLGRVRAAGAVCAGLPTDHPEFDPPTRSAFLAGVLGYVLASPTPPGEIEDVARAVGYPMEALRGQH